MGSAPAAGNNILYCPQEKSLLPAKIETFSLRVCVRTWIDREQGDTLITVCVPLLCIGCQLQVDLFSQKRQSTFSLKTVELGSSWCVETGVVSDFTTRRLGAERSGREFLRLCNNSIQYVRVMSVMKSSHA